MRLIVLFILCVLMSVCAVHAQTPAGQNTNTTTSTTPDASGSPDASAASSSSHPAAVSTPTPRAAVGGAPVLTEEKARPVRLVRFDKPPAIDGKLDEEVWKTATLLKDFYQTSPGDNIAPSHPTEVRIGYDSHFLYIGFRAYDEPDKVRATIAKRDAVFDDDNVSIYLDTFNDQRKAYYFTFNPLGVQADAIYTEGVGEDLSVDVVMESKGVVDAEGYTVEVAIPFKSLRYEVGRDKLWGVQAFRQIKRLNNENDSWMPISRDKSGLLNQAGHITGLEGVSAERTLELIPSLTLSETGRRVATLSSAQLAADPTLLDPGRFVNEPIGNDLGLTAKLVVSSALTLDLAINPDFAQVEADAPVVTANQRFSIFFEEKRPFFLEGKEIFETPLQAVHTRAIVDPDLAVKLSGKRGKNTFGLLFASDNAPGNFTEEERNDPSLLPTIGRFIDKNSSIGILRLKRDVGQDSSLGFIATSYNFPSQYNYLGGVDGRVKLNQQTYLDFQALATNSRVDFLPDDPRASVCKPGTGFGYSFSLDNEGRHFGYRASGTGRTSNYCALVGFTPRVNTNQEDLFVRYNSEPNPNGKLISWQAYNSFRPRFDWQGRSQSWTNESQLSFNLVRQTSVGVGATEGYERVFEFEFGPPGTFAGTDSERSVNRKSIYAFGSTNPNKLFSAFFLGIYTWGAFDFDFGAGPKFPRVSTGALLDPSAPLDPGGGNSLDLQGTFTFQPTDALRTSLDYIKSRLVRHDTGRVAFDDNIYSLHATYQFTRFSFVRARLDYDSLFSNLRGEYLYGWTPNPGTAFYVGYNDDWSHNFFSPFTGQPEPGFRRNGRTFFVKATYLFRRSL